MAQFINCDSNEVDRNIILIQLVSKEPIIYNKSLNEYKDKIKKKKIWEEIASKMCIVLNEEVPGKCIFNHLNMNSDIIIIM